MGVLDKLIYKTIEKLEGKAQVRVINSFGTAFTPYDGKQWKIAPVRSAVGSFARHASKLSPRHVRLGNGAYEEVGGNINRILQQRPNPYLTACAFYCKIAVQYELNNNAFIYPVWNGNALEALYPIDAATIDVVESAGTLYCVISFKTGRPVVVPYVDIIHIRNYFHDNDLFGSDNRALDSVLETVNAFNQSMSAFAKLVSVVRGILKFRAGGVSEEDLTKARDRFVQNNMIANENNAGIVVSGGDYEYEAIKDNAIPIPTGQLQHVRTQVFDYFGTNESIVHNKFTEQQWNAYYEGKLKPFFEQLGQALTNVLFTERERGFGNRIVCETSGLRYAGMTSKIAVVKLLSAAGALTVDRMLTIFGELPIGGEEGARRLQSLNFVNVAGVDGYQGITKKEGDDNNADS